MGAALSSQLTTRPSLVREISRASSSTRRCFMKPGKDMSCGAASSETARSPPLRDSRMPRRVRSASAANTVSSSSAEYLTIRFSIAPRTALVNPRVYWAGQGAAFQNPSTQGRSSSSQVQALRCWRYM